MRSSGVFSVPQERVSINSSFFGLGSTRHFSLQLPTQLLCGMKTFHIMWNEDIPHRVHINNLIVISTLWGKPKYKKRGRERPLQGWYFCDKFDIPCLVFQTLACHANSPRPRYVSSTLTTTLLSMETCSLHLFHSLIFPHLILPELPS